jgi:acetoin utilization protein AcuB
MPKAIPTIQKYMTTSPHTIGIEQPIEHAHKLMIEHRVRHLPVLDGGKLVGIVTARDLALIESFDAIDPHTTQVDDAMSGNVYSVSPDAGLDEVVMEMAEKKYGSAVVIQNGHVVGMFTTVDVCRALGELLHSRLAQ